MNEKEKAPLTNSEGDLSLGCDVNMDRCLAESEKKKRDTSFVDVRRGQIELYGSYYSSGLNNEEILEWISLERSKLQLRIENLELLENTTKSRIESAKQAKLSAIVNGLSESEKEQLKSILE